MQSESHHREAWDHMEVARVGGQHGIAERQRCGSDQQVAARHRRILLGHMLPPLRHIIAIRWRVCAIECYRSQRRLGSRKVGYPVARGKIRLRLDRLVHELPGVLNDGRQIEEGAVQVRVCARGWWRAAFRVPQNDAADCARALCGNAHESKLD